MHYNIYKDGVIYLAGLSGTQTVLGGLDSSVSSVFQVSQVVDGVERFITAPFTIVTDASAIKAASTMTFPSVYVLAPTITEIVRQATGEALNETWKSQLSGTIGQPWTLLSGEILGYDVSSPSDVMMLRAVAPSPYMQLSVTIPNQSGGLLSFFWNWSHEDPEEILPPLLSVRVNGNALTFDPAYTQGIEYPSGTNTFVFEFAGYGYTCALSNIIWQSF